MVAHEVLGVDFWCIPDSDGYTEFRLRDAEGVNTGSVWSVYRGAVRCWGGLRTRNETWCIVPDSADGYTEFRLTMGRCQRRMAAAKRH